MSSRDVMEESWISLRLKMADMPYYEYKTEDEKDSMFPDQGNVKEGTIDDLKRIAGKYIHYE